MSDSSLTNTILESVLKEAMGLNTSSVGPSSLKHALARRMRALEMENTLSYIRLLKSSSQELTELIEEVAVNETWFFRDQAPFIALRDYASNFSKNHTGQALKLLSIPCSTGEEPYSMAISLVEAGIPTGSFTIDAVDISRRSLAIAQKAVYRSHSFRDPYAQQYQGYFTKTKHGYALDKRIKDLVRFHCGNLIHLSPPLTSTTYQVIFCRNLLIYLDSSYHQQAINTFDTLLADNGLLVIGHVEAGIFTNSCFCPAPYPKAFALQKKDQHDKPSSMPPTFFAAHAPASMQQNLDSDAAADLDTPLPDHSKQDKCDQMIRACEEEIRKNGTSADIFYKLATLFEQKRHWQTAIKMLKKSIYLDPNYIDAIDMLAAIYQRLGDDSNYQACLQRGQRIISRLSSPTTAATK